MRKSISAAVEINEAWHVRVNRLPLNAGALLADPPSDDEVAEIIEKHCDCGGETK